MTAKQASEILNKSKNSRTIRDYIASRTDDKIVRSVWKRACEKLSDIHGQYPDIPKAEQMHTEAIFNTAAIYLALKAVVPDKAEELIEGGMAVCAKKKAKSFQRMCRFPFGKSLFMKVFAFGVKTTFGEKAGFEQRIHTADRKVLRFDVLKCPYVNYLTALGCAEIAHLFCENDIYCYGSLDGIAFERSQTLGTGGERCDFYLHRQKQTKHSS